MFNLEKLQVIVAILVPLICQLAITNLQLLLFVDFENKTVPLFHKPIN